MEKDQSHENIQSDWLDLVIGSDIDFGKNNWN